MATQTVSIAKLFKAIAAQCKDCIYDDAAPGRWRQQVKTCRFEECPLYPYRPMPRER